MKNKANLITLFVLGFVWSSFALFTKICAETLSPVFIAFGRLLIAAIMLYLLCLIQKKSVFLKENYKFYAVIGFFNSSFPFVLFAYSARNLDSGIVSILDGTVSIFEMLISIYFLKKAATKGEVFGVLIGLAGVVMTYFSDGFTNRVDLGHLWAILLILFATCSFAIASIYIDLNCKEVDSLTLATGSVIFSLPMFLPFLPFIDIGELTARSGISLLGLGVISTGLAYILYFKLLVEESPRFAVSVSLIIPIFGILHGALFLGEEITLMKVAGCLAILLSIKFILKISLTNFFK